MTSPSIEFDNVWKKFQRGELHDSLRDLIPAMARRLMGRVPRKDELSQGEFWAVRDVSFSVRPGEALGIIGPNGAGKSTILKLLTQILTPTRGRCMIHGRAGALIEVSAGFHPDLTGRENIFLQGAIMEMRSREIARRFDEIVAFAEIEQFIDTPAKRYSSGMNARLGFAISTRECGVELPENGPFEVEIELQFNVPPGVVSVETSVWDRTTHRDLARGPAATLQLMEGMKFAGTVHMQPRMHLAAPRSATGQGALADVFETRG